jgi:hypothetical protein
MVLSGTLIWLSAGGNPLFLKASLFFAVEGTLESVDPNQQHRPQNNQSRVGATAPVRQVAQAAPRAAIVLACVSKDYFQKPLFASGAHPLLLTTQLMAPEAYTLDGAIRAWFSGTSEASVREAAAQAYNRYQKCGIKGARSLFAGPDKQK